MSDNLFWLLVIALFFVTIITAMIMKTVESVSKAKNLIEEAMKVPGVAYVEVRMGSERASEVLDAAAAKEKDDRTIKTCEEAMNDDQDDPQGE